MKKLTILTLLLMMTAGSAWAQAVANMNIQQNPIFGVSTNEVSAVIDGSELQLGADVVVTGGSGSYAYRWYTAEGELGNQNTLWVNRAADYFLDITDTCDCLQTVVFHVSGIDGIQTVAAPAKVRLAPNPTSGPVSISAPARVTQVVIFSESGAMLRVVNGNDIDQIDLTALAAGRYVLNIVTDNQKVSTARIIKK